jgi:hypothetical protein
MTADKSEKELTKEEKEQIVHKLEILSARMVMDNSIKCINKKQNDIEVKYIPIERNRINQEDLQFPLPKLEFGIFVNKYNKSKNKSKKQEKIKTISTINQT